LPGEDGANAAVVGDPGETGGPEPQSGGNDRVAALESQVAELQGRLAVVQSGNDDVETARRVRFDATAEAAAATVQAMPEGVEKEKQRVKLAAALVQEKDRRMTADSEKRDRQFAQSLEQQRDRYIDEKGREHGLSGEEIDLVKAAAAQKKVIDSEGVDKLFAPIMKRARAATGETQVPPIARVRTDSGAGQSGASKTYQDLLRDARERIRNGERVDLIDVRRDAARQGILPRRVGV